MFIHLFPALRRRVSMLMVLLVGFFDHAGATDVFRAAIGTLATYRYQSLFESWYYSVTVTIIDSGFVRYSVTKQTPAGDSNMVWQVLQIRDFVRHTTSPPSDSTTHVTDSTFFTITESLRDHHILHSSSLPWSSPPISSPWGFPLAMFGADTVHAYRYSDSSHVVLLSKGYPCGRFGLPQNYDSLVMSSDSGITRRAISICNDRDEIGTAFWTSFDLVSQIIVSIKGAPQPRNIAAPLGSFPNPFNPVCTVAYDVEVAGLTRLAVYDVLGREVAVLAEAVQRAGQYKVQFDGSGLPTGVYIVRMSNPGSAKTHAMILLR